MFPNISGRAKENRSRMGLPVVMFSVRAIMTPFCAFFLHFIGILQECQGKNKKRFCKKSQLISVKIYR
jgi:hypothetical protein